MFNFLNEYNDKMPKLIRGRMGVWLWILIFISLDAVHIYFYGTSEDLFLMSIAAGLLALLLKNPFGLLYLYVKYPEIVKDELSKTNK